jgi:glycerate dehydrogenase
MIGVILDANSLGQDIDLSPVTSLLSEWRVYPSTQPDEVASRISDATVVLSNKIRLDEASLANAPNVRFISVMATGTNNIDFQATKARDIHVSNAVAYATPSVVQHTISLILALSTNLPAYLSDVRSGRWQQSDVFCLLDHPIQEVAGKKLGIIGHGELGSAVAKAAAGLGLKVIVAGRRGEQPGPGRTPFEEVIREADYLTLHCPLTSTNENMINAELLSAMKPTAFLINTARGGLVDSQALVAALKDGVIAGAAIDVLNTEPAAANEPLITDLPNLLVTPHNAWGAIESRNRLINQMRENIEGFLAGKPPRLAGK